MDRTEVVRDLRRNMSHAEKLLWTVLRGHRMLGLKFRRQEWVCGYVADFLCASLRVVIEVDGEYHRAFRARDARRDSRMRAHGYYVIRLKNDDVERNLQQVVQDLTHALQRMIPKRSRTGQAHQ